jgi:DNA-directed RNA polymerase subunit F
MNATNSNGKSKPRRRRGLLVDEIAKDAGVSRYQAKQAIAIMKQAPELEPYVTSGELKLKQAIAIMKHAPELIAYVVDGRLPCAECDRVLRELRQRAEPELTFEERVEQSFRRWLSKWPKEDRKEVWELVEWLPPAKLADLMPENLAVEIDLEKNKQTTTERQNNR